MSTLRDQIQPGYRFPYFKFDLKFLKSALNALRYKGSRWYPLKLRINKKPISTAPKFKTKDYAKTRFKQSY